MNVVADIVKITKIPSYDKALVMQNTITSMVRTDRRILKGCVKITRSPIRYHHMIFFTADRLGPTLVLWYTC